MPLEPTGETSFTERVKQFFSGTPMDDVPKNLDPPNSSMEGSKFEGINNTLGSVAKGLSTTSMYLGMAIKGLGNSAGAAAMGVTLGAVAIPAGVVGLAGAGLTYGASRLMGRGHDEASYHAAIGAVGSGAAAAMTISLLAVPISLTAWCIKGVGSALMKPAGKENAKEAFKAFDESFSTHILPVLGKIGKETALHRITQGTFSKLTEKIDHKQIQIDKDARKAK
jgi:hypothetical protein